MHNDDQLARQVKNVDIILGGKFLLISFFLNLKAHIYKLIFKGHDHDYNVKKVVFFSMIQILFLNKN